MGSYSIDILSMLLGKLLRLSVSPKPREKMRKAVQTREGVFSRDVYS